MYFVLQISQTKTTCCYNHRNYLFQPILQFSHTTRSKPRSLPFSSPLFLPSSLWKRISSPFSLPGLALCVSRRGGPIIIAETRTDAKGCVAGYKRGNAPHKARPSRVSSSRWWAFLWDDTRTDFDLFLQTPTVLFSSLLCIIRCSFSLLITYIVKNSTTRPPFCKFSYDHHQPADQIGSSKKLKHDDGRFVLVADGIIFFLFFFTEIWKILWILNQG